MQKLLTAAIAFPAKLPELKYAYAALEPVLSAKQLELHHAKHHQTYVNNLNNIFQQLQAATKDADVKKVNQLTSAFKFNLGGHLNHSYYWDNLADPKNGGGVLPGENSLLRKEITKTWGSMENFMAEFTKRSTAIQGSGWGYLGYDINNKTLRMFELANQDLPETSEIYPLLSVDVWEHAYYVDYMNLRAKYLAEIWKIVDWQVVEKRFDDILNAK